MKTKRPFVPSFINQLDEYLLLHKPVIWTARTHLVLFYSLLFMAMLSVLSFIVPNDPRSDSSVFLWVTLTAILTVIGFIVWCIFLFRFNVFKRFGEARLFDALKTFLLYFIAIALMILPCYIPPAVESFRANNAYGHEELVKDINAINTKICQLEYDSLEHDWYQSKYIVRDTLTDRYYDRDDETIERSSQNNAYKIIDTATFNAKISNADSSVKVNDSTWHFYSCPSYVFLSGYNIDQYTDTKLYDRIQLYNLVIRNNKKADAAKTKAELNALLKKYSTNDFKRSMYYSEPLNIENNSYADKLQEKYNLYNVSNSFQNLKEKKYRWFIHNDSRARAVIYLSIIFALFVFIFRHSTTKTFFLTMLTGIILLVVSGLFLAFFRLQEEAGYYMFLLYYVAFFAISLTSYNRKTRLATDGIAINMITFFTVFLPLVCTVLYYEIDEKKYRLGIDYPVGYSERKELHYFLAEIAGLILLLVLIEPLFKRLYRNWFAKPEQ